MKEIVIPILVFVVLISGLAAFGHHSFTATYRTDETIEIAGELVQFQFRNPHSFVQIMAPDEHGIVQRWSVEWGGITQLGEQGVTRTTLRPGDIVIVTGSPGRDLRVKRLRMQSLRRIADGYAWGLGAGEEFD